MKSNNRQKLRLLILTKNLELNLRFLIHSSGEQILDGVLINLQKILVGNLMVDIEMPETNMLKEKVLNI